MESSVANNMEYSKPSGTQRKLAIPGLSTFQVMTTNQFASKVDNLDAVAAASANTPVANSKYIPRQPGRPIGADRDPDAMKVEKFGDRIRIIALKEAKTASTIAAENRRQLMAGIMANNAKILEKQEAERMEAFKPFIDQGVPTPGVTPEREVGQTGQAQEYFPLINNGDVIDLPEGYGQHFIWPTTWNGRQEYANLIFTGIKDGLVFLSEEQWTEANAMFNYNKSI